MNKTKIEELEAGDVFQDKYGFPYLVVHSIEELHALTLHDIWYKGNGPHISELSLQEREITKYLGNIKEELHSLERELKKL